MGSLSSAFVYFSQATFLLWIFIFFPGLPPNLEFTHEEAKVPVALDGPLQINNKLNNAKRLFVNELKGPEDLEIFNDELYMSVHGGKILKLFNGQLSIFLAYGKPCNGLWEERICGRPLGLKFDQSGALYIADAYYGILKANSSSGELSPLVRMDESIQGKSPMLPNSLDVAQDGSVYWSDSSTTHHLEDGVFIILGSGTGRLLKYSKTTERSVVLMDKLHFPNGVSLSHDESFILVAETPKSRILKYYLKGEKTGLSEVFVDRLPGLPDNIKRNGKDGFIVALLNPVDESLFSLFTLNQFPVLRKITARTLAFVETIFASIDLWFPNEYLKKAVHWIGHFESLYWLYKDHVIIVFLDEEGNITGSLHGTDGSVKCISDIVSFKGYYYLGSPYNPYLGKVEIQ